MLTTAPLNLHLLNVPNLPSSTDLYSDSRTHGYQGPTRLVRLPRATTNGGGAIAKSEDGLRCVVVGKESLRILRFYDPTQSTALEHKSSIGRGGHRIDASRNFWEGSGLKIDSASTDVAWGHGSFNNKVLTSARNGDLIMWDLNKSGLNKYERRSRDHIRSINKLSVSQNVPHYCITGSSDGDVRVWDLRDISKSLMRIHHPTSVREVIFSPNVWQPVQALVGLDNGSIYRWDLKMGQRGQLDRLPVAHSGPVMALDWCNAPSSITKGATGLSDGLGWIVSGGLDRCVKVWDLTATGSYPHIPHKATYTLHPSFPVRRVLWRPSYECELAIVSNEEFGTGSNHELIHSLPSPRLPQRVATVLTDDRDAIVGGDALAESKMLSPETKSSGGDAVEIWDVRRRWIAKWSVTGSAVEGGVTDIAFSDSHTIWAQHSSGTFSQIDLRDCVKPIDAVSRVAVAWEASGSLAFVSDRITSYEIPYDDVNPSNKSLMDSRKTKLKAIGDKWSVPPSQDFGTYVNDYSCQDHIAFPKLAEEYVFKGDNRADICSLNADTAIRNGKYEAAQAWLLLESLLTDLVPDHPPKAIPERAELHPYSAPTHSMTPLSFTFPQTKESILFKKASPERASLKTSASPSRLSPRTSEPPSTSTSRRMTPTSSNSPSPLFATTTLPSITSRQSSIQREADSTRTGSRRRSSTHRRPSLTGSPSASLRHVGEGALDESDSSSSSSGDGGGEGKGSGEEESSVGQHMTSPTLNLSRITPAHPSPLSKERWIEDEAGEDREDEASPSPRSTDSESGSSNSPLPRPKSSRWNSNRMRTRSHSSTTKSLAAASMPRSLVKQDSHSSIRTVTAGDLSFQEDILVKSPVRSTFRVRHGRKKSQAISELMFSPEDQTDDQSAIPDRTPHFTDRSQDIVRANEKRYREIGWDVLRNILELFADEGDIQMCAFLSLVAPQELRLKQRRRVRFLDSYIEILTRLRLYTSAASLRKYSGIENLGVATQLETIFHLACGRCRKPLSYAVGAHPRGENMKGTYAYCQTCNTYSVICSICRRPVRTLLYQCTVCTHGGHRGCYKRYYTEQPTEEVPSLFAPLVDVEARTPAKGSPSLGGLDHDNVTVTMKSEASPVHIPGKIKMKGHRCAAGCGHFCWVVNEQSGGLGRLF